MDDEQRKQDLEKGPELVCEIPLENERMLVVRAIDHGSVWWGDLEHVRERLGLLEEDAGHTE
jgi:hypothetical protein